MIYWIFPGRLGFLLMFLKGTKFLTKKDCLNLKAESKIVVLLYRNPHIYPLSKKIEAFDMQLID